MELAIQAYNPAQSYMAKQTPPSFDSRTEIGTIKENLIEIRGDIKSALKQGKMFAIGVSVAFSFMFYWYIPDQLEKTKAQAKAAFQEEILKLTNKIASLEGAQKLPEILRNKTVPQTKDALAKIADVTKNAKQNSVQTDPKPVAQLGQNLLTNVNWMQPELSTTGWQAVTSLMDYCSYLQLANLPNFKVAPKFTANKWGVDVGSHVIQDKVPIVEMFGTVPAKDAARAEHIGQPPTNTGLDVGPAIVVVEALHPGQILILDGHSMKNVVYVGFDVQYLGGAVVLNHVVFVNCSFHVSSNEKGRDFGLALFAGNLDRGVSFNEDGPPVATSS